MFGEHFSRVLVAVQLAALAVLLVRVVSQGLARTYTLFMAYLACQFAQSLIFLAYPWSLQDHVYQFVFMASETLNLVLATLIVLELYSLVFKDFPGVATVAKRYFRFALVASMLVSLILLLLERFSSGSLLAFLVFERALNTSLLVFIILITGFLLYYPIPLSKNIISYTIGYSTLFLFKSLAFFVRTTGTALSWESVLNDIPLIVSIGCVSYWIAFLTRAGETQVRTAVPRLSPEKRTQVLQQLESLNELLLRTAKK